MHCITCITRQGLGSNAASSRVFISYSTPPSCSGSRDKCILDGASRRPVAAIETARAVARYMFAYSSHSCIHSVGTAHLKTLVKESVHRAYPHAQAACPNIPAVSFPAAIHDMNRKQQPKHEQYCEDDWNEVSQIDSEAYWVSKVTLAYCYSKQPQITAIAVTAYQPAAS